MKYFTPEWCFSKLSDKIIEERAKAYADYMDSIYPKLPFTLKVLTQYLALHDGKIQTLDWIEKDKTLILRGIFGDLQTGYYFLEIKYLKTSNIDANILKVILAKQAGSVLADEIEYLPTGLFRHRLLFLSKHEISIDFEDIEINLRNAQPQDYS